MSPPSSGLKKKRRSKKTFNGLHSVISQKTEFFVTTGVRTSDPAYTSMWNCGSHSEDYEKYYFL
jgi:hypothetical protein